MNEQRRRCASCDIELEGEPLIVDGVAFCCSGCAQGGPCICTYEGEQGLYPRNGHHDTLVLKELFADGS